jgi:hypothetical protein
LARSPCHRLASGTQLPLSYLGPIFPHAPKETVMWRRVALCFLILAPGVASAQNVAERLLPGGSQIYLHWDGIDRHRTAFDKTALGKTLKEDTGKFLAALWTYSNEMMDLALRHADPNAAELVKEIPPILAGIHHHGVVFGIEVKSINPPEVEAVFVLPKAGGAKGSLLPMIQKLAELAHANVQQTKVGKRTVHEIANDRVHFGWWKESNTDVVLVLSTSSAVERAKLIDAGTGSFAQSKTFSKLAEFKEFSTWVRGSIDIAGLLGKVGDLSPQADKVIADLGIKGIQGVSFYSGFAGSAERSVVEVHTPEARKGLLALMNRKTITLADLPPLPSDVTSFSASNFNLRNLYDGGLQIAESAVNAFGNGAIDPKESVKQVEALLGVKFGEDLFGSFGDMYVSYSSPAEGPLGLGGVYLFKVKDEKKLADTLEGLFKAIPPVPFFEVLYQKRAYRGGHVLELKLKTQQGEFPVANMTIHKGWFMLANYPQSVYGFILRNNGDLKTWKASANLTKALAAFPQEFTAIAVSDPRPTVRTLLSVAPSIMTLANSILPNVLPGAPVFDVGVIPHAQDAVRHLYPNISVTTDDGKTIRTQTRASLALPF